jgi:hypothetical protein
MCTLPCKNKRSFVATVKKDNQLLRGERIRFSTKDSEVYVEQASGKLQRQSLGF